MVGIPTPDTLFLNNKKNRTIPNFFETYTALMCLFVQNVKLSHKGQVRCHKQIREKTMELQPAQSIRPAQAI